MQRLPSKNGRSLFNHARGGSVAAYAELSIKPFAVFTVLSSTLKIFDAAGINQKRDKLAVKSFGFRPTFRPTFRSAFRPTFRSAFLQT